MTHFTRKEVNDPTGQPAGTVTINTRERKLYLSEAAVGRCNTGSASGARASPGRARPRLQKIVLARMDPPARNDRPAADLPRQWKADGEPARRPGAYLFEGKKDTLFRIHGTNEPNSIGKAVSSGCIRMMDADVIDLYGRVAKGTPVVVL